ncbi:MAG: hypothetical protein DMG41_34185 [Acidobacteria bacterium]|nr:MAG: hypothetical protein DMG41_34185 [Acidobacteriota bacterium]
MPSNLPTAQTESNREARLAVLTSLAWLLLLPLGWFLTFSPLARQTLFRTVLGLAYLAVAFYKLLRWSAFFRKRDWITLAFALLSVYVLAFATILLWFWLSPPTNAGDWAVALGLFVMGGLFICAGLLLVLAPRIADKLGQLSGGQIGLRQSTGPAQGLRLGRRISGAFLLVVGGFVLSVAIGALKETWLR